MSVPRSYVWGIVGSLLCLAGCGKEKPPAAAPAGANVIIAHFQPVDMTEMVPGRVAPVRIGFLRPQVSGVLLRRFFTQGGDVQAGQQLYQIDPAPYQAVLDRQTAALRKAQAALRAAQSRKTRYTHLQGINAVSRQDYDDAVAAESQANADIAAADAEIEAARVNLTYTKMLAPISGRTSRSFITEGDLVTANQTSPLAIVTQLQPIYVDMTANVTELLHLNGRNGRDRAPDNGGPNDAGKVDLTLDDGRVYPEVGRIDFAEVNVDPGTGMTTIRASFANKDRQLLPGMFVHATIHSGHQAAMLIPQSMVLRDIHADPYVLVVGDDGTAQERKVTIRTDRGSNWVVTGGVKEGERIIADNLQAIHDGQKVRVDTTLPAAKL